MPWFKVDDTAHGHPKARAAGLAAMGLWAESGSYSRNYKLAGFVPRDYVTTWPQGAKHATHLVRVGMWHAPGDQCRCLPDDCRTDGWYFHDWEDYQTSEEDDERARQLARERQRKRRSKQAQEVLS